jgi:hypothetical protein
MFNSKTLALAMSVLAFVACAKSKHNVNIDGAYEVQSDSDVKKLISIKDNVATTYTLSLDQKYVEITKEDLIVRGTQLIGSEPIENLCDADAVAKENSAKLTKIKGGLVLSGIDDKGNPNAVSLKNNSAGKIAEIEQSLKDGTLKRGCIIDGIAMKIIIDGVAVDLPVDNKKIEDKAVGDKSDTSTEDKAIENKDKGDKTSTDKTNNQST